jgi:hypothetical protein
MPERASPRLATVVLWAPRNEKTFRKFVAFSASGVGAAGFACMIWNWFFFKTYSPREPNQQSGLIYPFNIKGHPVFVSAADVSYHAICSMLAIGFLVFGVMISIMTRTSTPWSTDDLAVPKGDTTLILLISFSITAGLLFFFGRKLADLLVTHGVILTFWS